jgi:hypothetical protein
MPIHRLDKPRCTPWGRRRFLAAALASLAAAPLACHPVAADNPELPLETLSATQYRIVIALVKVAFAGCVMVIPAEEVARRTDEYFAALDPSAADPLLRALNAFDRLIPAIYGHPHRFLDLSAEQRAEIVARITRSRGLMRDLGRVIKVVTVFAYYTHPAVRAQIGYVPFAARERRAGLDLTPLRITRSRPA